MKRVSYLLIVMLVFTLSSNSLHAQQVPYTFSITRLTSQKTKYQIFYNFLREQGYPDSMLGTVADFTKKIKSKDHATRLYNGLRKDGYSETTLGTEAEFIKKFCE